MIEQTVNRTEPNWMDAAHAALDVFRADTPRAADLETILEWVNEQTLYRTWASFIRQSFQTDADPLVACCQAGRAIVADYYSRPPLFHECVSHVIQNSFGEIIGEALFATLQTPTPCATKPSASRRR